MKVLFLGKPLEWENEIAKLLSIKHEVTGCIVDGFYFDYLSRKTLKVLQLNKNHLVVASDIYSNNSTFAAGNWEISLDVIGQGRHPVV